MKRHIKILFLLFIIIATNACAQTSKYTRYFSRVKNDTTTQPLRGAFIYLVPQASSFPDDTLKLVEHTTRYGFYYRESVPDGEYKIYINLGAGANLYEEHIWIGEKRLSDVADLFDSGKLKPSALDTIYLSTNVNLKKGEIASALVNGKIVIMVGIDSSGTIDSVASQRWIRAQSFIKYINGTDTVAYRSWVRAQNFGTGSGNCDLYARYLNPDHFKFSDDGDTVSIQDSILIRLIGMIDMSNYMTLSTTQTVSGNKTYTGNNDYSTGKVVLPSSATSPNRGQIWLDSYYLMYRNRAGDNDTSATLSYVRSYIANTTLSIQNLLPKTTGVYNLGSTSKRWNYLYVNHVSGGDISYDGTSHTFNAPVIFGINAPVTFNSTMNLNTAGANPNPDGTLTLQSANIYEVSEEGNENITTITRSELVDGEIIYLTNSSSTYTVTFYETGNLNLSTTTYVMGEGDTITLIYNATQEKWLELSRSDN